MFTQVRTFLIMFTGGLAIGVFYDVYKYLWLKKTRLHRRQNFGDLLFLFFSLVLIAGLLFYSNCLELRFYVFLAIGLGILVYFKVIKLLIKHFDLK